MEEKTTTEAVVDAGVQETLPAEPMQAKAVQAPAEPIQNSSEDDQEAPQAIKEDDDLDSWAEKVGLKLDSDNTRKAAQMARDAKRAANEKFQKASEMEKLLSTKSDKIAEQVAESTGQDIEVIRRLQRIEVKESVRDFWANNPEARQYEAQMIETLNEKPHLAGDLDSLYANALRKSGALSAAKSEGKKEALSNLAQKQQATAPIGNAVNSGISPKEKPFNELSLAEMESKLGFARR